MRICSTLIRKYKNFRNSKTIRKILANFVTILKSRKCIPISCTTSNRFSFIISSVTVCAPVDAPIPIDLNEKQIQFLQNQFVWKVWRKKSQRQFNLTNDIEMFRNGVEMNDKLKRFACYCWDFVTILRYSLELINRDN